MSVRTVDFLICIVVYKKKYIKELYNNLLHKNSTYMYKISIFIHNEAVLFSNLFELIYYD